MTFVEQNLVSLQESELAIAKQFYLNYHFIQFYCKWDLQCLSTEGEIVVMSINMLKILLDAFERIESLLSENYMNSIAQTPLSWEAKYSHWWRKRINGALGKIGIRIVSLRQYYDSGHDPQASASSIQSLQEVIKSPARFDAIYDLLEDDESKKTFIWFIQYRVAYALLGNKAKTVYPPPVDLLRWKKYTTDIEASKLRKDIYKVGPYRIHCTDNNALTSSWLEEVYRLKGTCEPEKGDWIIDGGAFQGDTALWFSKLVGPEGQVFAFEPFSDNYKILIENLERNKITNVIPVPKAMYNQSGVYAIAGNGQGAMLVKGNVHNNMETISIDEYTQLQNCPRVDFIKMDIEGAEVPALEGAINTIQKYSPKLAISIYHKGSDIVEIPELIKRIQPNYKLFLRHRSDSWVDTVLYAVAR